MSHCDIVTIGCALKHVVDFAVDHHLLPRWTGHHWIVLSIQVSAASRLVSAVMCFLIIGFLRPDHPNYPNVRRRFRIAIGIAGLCLAYIGVELLWRVDKLPAQPFISGYTLSAGVLFVCTTGLMEVLQSWLPAKMRERIDTFRRMPTCLRRDKARRERNRAALLEARGSLPTEGLDALIPESLRAMG